MTKEEMKEMITTKIKGQGNQVDLSGAVAEVLDSLVDAMGGEEIIEITSDMVNSPITKEFEDKLRKASIIKYLGNFYPRIGYIDSLLYYKINIVLDENRENYDDICFAYGYEVGDDVGTVNCFYVTIKENYTIMLRFYEL